MTRPQIGRGRRRVLQTSLVAVAASLVLAAGLVTPVLAAGTEWGTPSASSLYGVHVGFTQPVTLPTDTTRVEMLLTVPGADGPFVTEVVPEALGRPTTLDFTYDAASSHVYPNTRFEGRWRVTRADGSVDVGPSTSVTYADTSHDWRTKTGDIIRLHWYAGDERFAERALAVGEEGLRKASDFLGVTESDPVDFFIYGSRDDFMQAFGSGSYEWAGAFALPETRTLIADIAPDELDTVLFDLYVPHELAHVAFDTATANPYHEPPRWLNEGLAVYLTEGYAPNWRGSIRDGVAEDRLLPLGAIATVFPTSADGADLAYAESVSAVSHMVDAYGKDALVRLVRAYADGVSDDEAFVRGLGVTVAEFEDGWLRSVGAQAPAPQGPQPAPPGPVPSAWLASSPGPTSPEASAAIATSPAPTGASGPPAAGAATPPTAGPSGGGSRDDGSGMPLFIVTVVAVVGVAIASIAFYARAGRRRPAAPSTAGGPGGPQAAVGSSPAAPEPPPSALEEGAVAADRWVGPDPLASRPAAPALGPRPVIWAPEPPVETPPSRESAPSAPLEPDPSRAPEPPGAGSPSDTEPATEKGPGAAAPPADGPGA